MRFESPGLLATLALLATLGCSSGASEYDAAVQGTVTIDGELAPAGTVTFIPVKKGPTAIGAIAANGSYALRVGQGNIRDPDRSKLPAGEYVVTVEVNGPPDVAKGAVEGGPLHLGPRLSADKYVDGKTSGLKFDVKAGLNVFDLKLDGPWANPPKDEEKVAGESADDAADGPAPEGDVKSAETDAAAPSEDKAGDGETPDAGSATPGTTETTESGSDQAGEAAAATEDQK